MMRKIIEYLRRKQNITIEDLVVEICSSTMYYKYLSKEKNLSSKNLKLIKERLGADDLTKEEIVEYKRDIDKVTNNILRYYISKDAFTKDIGPLIEIEAQLLLTEELCIDYIISKVNYLLLTNDIDEINKLLILVEEFIPVMNVTQRLFYYQLKIFYLNYKRENIKDILNEFAILLENNKYNKEYGKFHMSIALAYLKVKDREHALHSIETALSLFTRDLNLIGQVKATNMKAFMIGESRRYEDALELFLSSYKSAKQINFTYEMFVALTNIITAYFGIKDFDNVKKYWVFFQKHLRKESCQKIKECILNNTAINLFTNFDYFGMNDQLEELVQLLNDYNVTNNITLESLIKYYNIQDEDEKVKYIEDVLLPLVTGKAHFSYCKWILDKCVRYFSNNRMYKKAADFEMKYLLEFKKYYFN